MINLLIDKKKLDKFIIRLIIFANNYYKYDKIYLKKNYNLNSHVEFISFFKKNYKKKILFSSLESEQLFINFLNIDFNFLLEKYQEFYPIKILNFFIARKKFYFNYCHFSNNNKYIHNYKHTKDLCSCNIKVKTVVNLPIESLLFILEQNTYKNNKQELSLSNQLLSSHLILNNKSIKSTKSIKSNKSTRQKNIIKIIKNNESKDIIKCFSNLEKANDKLGLDVIDNHYTIDSSSINDYNHIHSNDKNNINFIETQLKTQTINKNIKTNIFPELQKLKNSVIENEKNINVFELDKSNHLNQFSTESINIFNNDFKINENLIPDTKTDPYSDQDQDSESDLESDLESNLELDLESEQEIVSKTSSKSDEISINEKKNNLNKKQKIKECIDLIINKLQTNNNILFEDDNLSKICIGLKKIVKNECSNQLAIQFDRIYQKTILTNKISDTEDMEKYYNLINQLNEFKKLL